MLHQHREIDFEMISYIFCSLASFDYFSSDAPHVLQPVHSFAQLALLALYELWFDLSLLCCNLSRLLVHWFQHDSVSIACAVICPCSLCGATLLSHALYSSVEKDVHVF